MTKAIKQAGPATVPPRAITLIGPTISVMQQSTVLIRQGYFPDPNMPVEFFGAMGTMQIILIPGTPEAHYVNAAAVAMTEAADREQAQYLRDVEAAATRQIAQGIKAEAEAKRAALIIEQQAVLAALEKEMAATVAVL